VWLCPPCHARSTCRAEVHIDIMKATCSGCGSLSSCFRCGTVTIIDRRAINAPASIAQYRHTKLLRQYKKIRI